MNETGKPITQLLFELKTGKQEILEELLPLVYDQLRQLATGYLRRERENHTLQPTALVHEAYLKLIGQKPIDWQNRAHFFGVATRLMREILIEHARARHRDKRGGYRTRVGLNKAVSFQARDDLDVIELDEALKRLEILDKDQARIVELRFFGGLTIEETAEVLKISPATVKREWTTAKFWLLRELS